MNESEKVSSPSAALPWDATKVSDRMRARERTFGRGDIVAIFGQRGTYTVEHFDKRRDEVCVRDYVGCSAMEWAGWFYLVKRARYEDVAPPSEADASDFARYANHMGFHGPRFPWSIHDD